MDIDYAFFERQYHENHYMRTNLPGGSHSSTPWGSPQLHSVHFADAESQPERGGVTKEAKSTLDYQIQSPHIA